MGQCNKMYNSKSAKAEEFICHEEILRTISYADENKDNKQLMEQILIKARECKGIDYKEAAVLLQCEDEQILSQIYTLAAQIKEKIYGKRIVMFAPLYLSNYCVNGCTYCPYHHQNKTICRKQLSQEEIKKETIALQDLGHKRIALETGEDPVNCPIEYVLESMKTIYSTNHKNGAIRRANVNIAATTVENYRKLKDAGIGTYILFQETYNKENYEALHPTGPKHNYAYHTEAMDRAMQGGIDDVGIGVLFGLTSYTYDFTGLMLHAKHLEDTYGVGPHTISVPRIRRADDVDVDAFDNTITDQVFKKIVSIIRIAVPYAGIIISTRESEAVREEVLKIGVSQISGGSKTSVGGYDEATSYEENASSSENTEQFEIEDTRTLDEIVNWLLKLGYVPSFCTACYREGRTGDRFMQFAKTGQIANICQANSLMTLKEYLTDYAKGDTKSIGLDVINREIQKVPNEQVKDTASKYLDLIEQGQRDFRF